MSTKTEVDRDAYIDEMERWRARRVAQLTAPDSWLTLIGLEWLTPGPNRIGRATDNDIVISTGPAHLGAITLTVDGHARIELAAGVDAQIEGTAETAADLYDDVQSGGHPTVVRFGTASFIVIDRDGRKGVRVRDNNAPTRTQYMGLDYYPINLDWRIDATWLPVDSSRTLAIPTTLGAVRERSIRGKAIFTHRDTQYELIAVGSPIGSVQFVIADATSGLETYGGARFLSAEVMPDGGIVLDFNKATNPPCAFTPYATCPLAPPENRLPFPVTAGEKMYRGSGH